MVSRLDLPTLHDASWFFDNNQLKMRENFCRLNAVLSSLINFERGFVNFTDIFQLGIFRQLLLSFTDDEPIEMSTKPLVQLDRNNPNLWYVDSIDLKKLPQHYLMLSKSRLTLLVCITSAAGYGLASSANMCFDPYILLVSTVGVGLTSASANSINQFLEVPFDSQMMRTRNRVLVRGLLSPWHAIGFATATGLGGAAMIWHYVNPIASILSLGNIFLYTSIYTPMKRLSILNTWVGSVVGAIPPVRVFSRNLPVRYTYYKRCMLNDNFQFT